MIVKNSISNYEKQTKTIRRASKVRNALFIFSLQKSFEVDKKELRDFNCGNQFDMQTAEMVLFANAEDLAPHWC